MKKIFCYFFILSVAVSLSNCAEEENAALNAQRFTAIFDNSQFSQTFKPIDMVQTLDGGYLVLGERGLTTSNFSGIYLLKISKLGNFEKELEVASTSVHPIGNLTPIGDKYYFMAMDENATAQLINVEQKLEVEPVVTPLSFTFPLAMAFVDNQFLVQYYDKENQETVLAKVSQAGAVGEFKNYPIGAGSTNLDLVITNHFIRTGKKLPFMVGKTAGNQYYFNGFFNYTFSLVFSDFSSDDPFRVEGQQDQGGFCALMPLTGSKFAASRFNFGDNYFLPNVDINTGDITNISDDSGLYDGLYFRELTPNALVKIHRATIDAKPVVIYGSSTISKQIGLYVYDENTGAFIKSKYLGFSNTYEIANIISTTDGGLAVSGVAYMAGRFPRICLFKLSKKDIEELVN